MPVKGGAVGGGGRGGESVEKEAGRSCGDEMSQTVRDGGKSLSHESGGKSSGASQPGRELSLPSSSAGRAAVLAQLDQVDSEKAERETFIATGQVHNFPQLKCYGRRNRAKLVPVAKQVFSPQILKTKGDNGEDDAVTFGGRLAVDLSAQLDSGANAGSGGSADRFSSSEIASKACVTVGITAEGSLRQEVVLEEAYVSQVNDLVVGHAIKTLEGEVAGEASTLDEAELGSQHTHISSDELPDECGERTRRDASNILSGNEGDSVGEDITGAGRGLVEGEASEIDRPSISTETAVLSGSDEDDDDVVRKECVTSSGLVAVSVEETLADEASEKFAAETQYTSEDSPIVRLKRVQDICGSDAKLISKFAGSTCDADQERIRKKGGGRGGSRSRKNRVQTAKEDADRVEEEQMASAYQDSAAEKSVIPQWRLALERRQQEDSVLAKADEVWAKHEILDSTKKVPAKGKEPARCKTHWDFVLEEMAWLAKAPTIYRW